MFSHSFTVFQLSWQKQFLPRQKPNPGYYLQPWKDTKIVKKFLTGTKYYITLSVCAYKDT